MAFRHKRLAALVSVAAGALLLTSAGGAAAAGTVTYSGVTLHMAHDPGLAGGLFDISWVEQSTGRYFLADRQNNAVDWFDVSGGPHADHFVKFLGQGQFVGAGPKVCPVPHACSGPNGVVTDSMHRVWAGDGDSTVKMIDPANSSAVALTIHTGGKLRADEMAYDPTDQMIIVANDADGFLSFINVATGKLAGHYYYADTTVTPAAPEIKNKLATAGNGLEQSVWNPANDLFYQAVPANTLAPGKGASTTGRIDVFKPRPDAQGNGQLVTSISVPGCDNGPTGLVLAPNHTLIGACDNGGVVVDVPSALVQTIIPNVGGADEVWYNPGDGNVYFARSGPAMLGVANATTDQFIANLPTTKFAHSVAAYAANNTIMVPLNGLGIKLFTSGTAGATSAPLPAPVHAPAQIP